VNYIKKIYSPVQYHLNPSTAKQLGEYFFPPQPESAGFLKGAIGYQIPSNLIVYNIIDMCQEIIFLDEKHT
jgi:hypothetical protein